jgi:DtxR family Mn-dependent transcriptional regulator
MLEGIMADRKTVSMEDYLEAILHIKKKDGVARVSSISDALGVKKPSVSYAVKRLTEEGLVRHEDYGYVDLTAEGQKLAEGVLEKHKLLTTFIADILGVDGEDAELEACNMEHYLSDETREKLEGLVEFILLGPRKEEWLENLRYYQENRERSPECLRSCRESKRS